MPSYSRYTIEELRLEDYRAGRKGSSSFGGSSITPQTISSSPFSTQPPSTSSPFSSSTAPALSNGFGSSSTGAFGSVATNGFSSGGGAFNKPNPFGSTTAAGTTAFNAGFGSSSTAPSPFGAKPTGFGLSAQTTPSPFGTSGAATPSPFGSFSAQRPTTQSSPFGTTSSTTGTTGTGTTSPFGLGSSTLGAPKPFGSSPSSFGFGSQQQPQQQQPFGFGSQQQQQPQQPQQQQSPSPFGFGSQQTNGTAAGTSSLFGGSSTTLQQQQQPQQTSSLFGGALGTQSKPSTSLFGNGGGFGGFGNSSANGTGGGTQTTPFGTSTPGIGSGGGNGSTSYQQPSTTSFGNSTAATPFQFSTPSSSASSYLTGANSLKTPFTTGFGGSNTAGNGGIGTSSYLTQQQQQPAPPPPPPSIPLPSLESQSIRPPIPSGLLKTERPSSLGSLKKKEDFSSSISARNATPTQRIHHQSTSSPITFRLSKKTTALDSSPKAKEPLKSIDLKASKDLIEAKSIKNILTGSDGKLLNEIGNANDDNLEDGQETATPATNHHLQYTKPSLEALKKFTYAQLFSVKDFVIGQRGIGEVRFSEPVDLSGIRMADLFEKIVIFEKKQISVYPEEHFPDAAAGAGGSNTKPAPGKGLNVKAEIRLHSCYPLSKATRLPIKEMGDERMVAHLERLKGVPGTRFVDFLPSTGTWIFEVDQF